eukprot:TRINITY_DN43989_c0_g1_i1.p1 TRINITY_DN43989_c0_g1~~TRINITY_DN43989_c0_g1_i1.p1  ORF type:complete len:288 (+),score=72.47 TRINITY_DN43989_c0_g1_i1:87-866(+)
MTNYKEEQELEIEALQSLFNDGTEFISLSDAEFKLHLCPFPAGEEENHVRVTLHVTYTAEYPDTAPEWELEEMDSLPDEKQADLRSQIEEVVNSSLGMAMVYSMAEACQDFLKANNVKILSMHEEMMKRLGGGEDDEEGGGEDDDDGSEEEQQEEEWKGLADKTLCPESERVKVEDFAKWKLDFDAEMIACGILRREGENKARTGKQIFMEAQKRQKDEETGGSGGYAPGAAAAPLVYDATLFGEEMDDDLDDLSGGED